MKSLQLRVKELANVLGKRYGSEVGDLYLEKRTSGYTILEVTNENGGVCCPFGDHVYSLPEMLAVINFALRAIQVDRLNGRDSAQYWPDKKDISKPHRVRV